jgi:hypothetical protein
MKRPDLFVGVTVIKLFDQNESAPVAIRAGKVFTVGVKCLDLSGHILVEPRPPVDRAVTLNTLELVVDSAFDWSITISHKPCAIRAPRVNTW